MQLKPFKEKNPKKVGIILFTISCILLISGVILYRTFAIFQVNENQNMIEGTVQDMGDVEFAFYQEIDGKDTIVTNAPTKDSGYSLDTSSSYCVDMETGNHISNITWDDERWGPFLANVSKTKTKCYLHFKQIYKDGTLNGAIPDLMNGRLVPIKISDTEKPSDIDYVGAQAGKVTKADITSEWYNYSKQQWANAVILRDGKTDTYKPGDEIKESDIESYFVWIPRYRYKLKQNESTYDGYTTVTNVGNKGSVNDFYNQYSNQAINQPFEIIFETKNDGVKTGNTKDTYITHPAFVAFDSNGMWVGKFETGYNQNTSNENVIPDTTTWKSTGAEQNIENSSKVIIKPNVYSWRNIQVANAFYTSYHYQRDLESHMMKNTEWGAVAYLTHSKYGRCKDNNCTEINMNNSEYFITGMSTIQQPTCGYTGTKETCNTFGGPSELSVLNSGNIKGYYLKESQGGSTTSNYSGIYDMSGGAFEYVMGVMQSTESGTKAPASGRSNTYNSGFNGKFTCYTCDGGSNQPTELTSGKLWPSSKYYDLYDYKTTNVEYQKGILGDATKEVGPFYSVAWPKKDGSSTIYVTRYVSSYNADLAYFVMNGYPWFGRGGARHYGTDAGIFALATYYGEARPVNSFRIILTP